jgi:hypothetical protein
MLIGAAIMSLITGSASALNRPVPPGFAKDPAEAPAIKQVVSNCIFEPRSFQCNSNLVFTTGDFAVAVQRMFGLRKPSNAFFFADVPPESPIYASVQAAAPFMNWRVLCPGCEFSGNFGADQPVPQSKIGVALVRLLIAANKVELLSPDEADGILSRFPDAAVIPGPARPFIATAVSSGIIPLFHRQRLEPAVTYSRFEGALVLEAVAARYGILPYDDRGPNSERRGRDSGARDPD